VTLPEPKPGLVIRYSYLWRTDFLKGQEEGTKARPCAIIAAVQRKEGETVVTVLPITHSAPALSRYALEIPAITKRRLGLDSDRSWIMFDEANQFVWPGPDLRSLSNQDFATVAFGALPPNFFAVLRERFVAALREHRARIVPRSE
jgi:hypothetical protein